MEATECEDKVADKAVKTLTECLKDTNYFPGELLLVPKEDVEIIAELEKKGYYIVKDDDDEEDEMLAMRLRGVSISVFTSSYEEIFLQDVVSVDDVKRALYYGPIGLPPSDIELYEKDPCGGATEMEPLQDGHCLKEYYIEDDDFIYVQEKYDYLYKPSRPGFPFPIKDGLSQVKVSAYKGEASELSMTEEQFEFPTWSCENLRDFGNYTCTDDGVCDPWVTLRLTPFYAPPVKGKTAQAKLSVRMQLGFGVDQMNDGKWHRGFYIEAVKLKLSLPCATSLYRKTLGESTGVSETKGTSGGVSVGVTASATPGVTASAQTGWSYQISGARRDWSLTPQQGASWVLERSAWSHPKGADTIPYYPSKPWKTFKRSKLFWNKVPEVSQKDFFEDLIATWCIEEEAIIEKGRRGREYVKDVSFDIELGVFMREVRICNIFENFWRFECKESHTHSIKGTVTLVKTAK